MGLLEVVHPGIAVTEQHFAELIQQRSRRGRNGTVAHRHAQDRLLTPFLCLEPRRVLAQQFRQRNPVDAGHLTRIRHQLARRTTPDHHRCHHEAGPGGEVIQPPEDRIRRQRQPHFLLEFAQRADLRRLPGIETTAGERPLPRVATQMAGPAGEYQRRLGAPSLMGGKPIEVGAQALFHHGQGNGSVVVRVHRMPADGERFDAFLQQLPQVGVAHEFGFGMHGSFANGRSAASIAVTERRTIMLVTAAETMKIIARCARIDDLLTRHASLWRVNPYREPAPDWIQDHPGLAAVVIALDETRTTTLEQNPDARMALLAPYLPDLAAMLAECEPPQAATRISVDRFAGTHIPGRKWQQIRHFLGALPASRTPAVDWCAGKGHLGRTLARMQGRSVRCLERDPALCNAGSRLAGTLPVTFEHCDVLEDVPAIGPHEALFALHACGALHERLLERAIAARVPSVAVAPCCYHLTPRWQPRGPAWNAPQLDYDALHLAVEDTVTAPGPIRRARLKERAFRTGYDALQRSLRGIDAYLPQPSLRGPERRLGFESFCARLASHHGLDIPAGTDLTGWLRLGWERDARCRRLELVRHGFSRLLELRIVLDRALGLAAADYRVSLTRFCPRALTPRNLLLTATR
ncbi:MAG: methyltransferase [Gammaproteobacteria bacterium]|nr:MAG: methyltransferase [Gammaproteobacteria bacterium]